MKRIPLFLTLAIATFLAACQSNSYHVNGTVEGIEDGETLYVTRDLTNGVPCDSIVVKDGKFSFEGETDSVCIAIIYSKKLNDIRANFFIEPGDITVNFSKEPFMTRVSGTNCNDLWQEAMDSSMVIGKEINRIAENIYSGNVSEEEMMKKEEEIMKLMERSNEFFIRQTKNNIKNDFGYCMLLFLPKEIVSTDDYLSMINELPDDKRQRPAIKALEESIKNKGKSEAGKQLPDFTQPAPDGTPVNIKDQYSQHKVTIIDFWASWCGPCRAEMPELIALYNDYKDKGLGIVGVSLDDDATAWQTAIRKLSLPWSQMSDLKGWKNAAAQQLNIESIPHTIVVDQKGVILVRGLRGKDLRAFIEEQLKK